MVNLEKFLNRQKNLKLMALTSLEFIVHGLERDLAKLGLPEEVVRGEIQKRNLRVILLETRGDIERAASMLGSTVGEVLETMAYRGLNLKDYQRLGKPVEEFDDGALLSLIEHAHTPYFRDDGPSLTLQSYLPLERLNRLGWRRYCLEGMEIWEKGPSYTSMRSRIAVDYNSTSIHIVILQIYDRDNTLISSYLTLENVEESPSSSIARMRKRFVFATAEQYLSGTTGIEWISEMFSHSLLDKRFSRGVRSGLAEVRQYLSGGLILDPKDCYQALKLVKKYSMDAKQVAAFMDTYLRGLYATEKRDTITGGFSDFMKKALGPSNR